MSVVSTSELTRRFGPVTALDRLTVELPAAGVIGLVGPNGSGKSTLIRILLGLIRPTGGSASVLGSSVHTPRHYAARVGVLIESPAFIPGLSARANLVSLARLRRLPLERVDAVLAQAGLAGRDREPVKRFSLGMKQRLGIAAALLPTPSSSSSTSRRTGSTPRGSWRSGSSSATSGATGGPSSSPRTSSRRSRPSATTSWSSASASSSSPVRWPR